MLERISTSISIKLGHKTKIDDEYVVNIKIIRDNSCLLSDVISYQLLKKGTFETRNYIYSLNDKKLLTIKQKDLSSFGLYHSFTFDQDETLRFIRLMTSVKELAMISKEERLQGRLKRLQKKFLSLRKYHFKDKEFLVTARYIDAFHNLKININDRSYQITKEDEHEYIEIEGERVSSENIILTEEDFI